jgi:hypothetical protein
MRGGGAFLRLLAILVAVVVVGGLALAQPHRAFADDIAVYVGYPGGPYYEKAYYTDAQLRAMSDETVHEYTSFDGGGFLRKGFGMGPRLYNIFNSSGINPWAVWRFYFGTADSYIEDDGGSGEEAWYYSQLAGSRYYFPLYPQWYDFSSRTITEEGIDALWASAYEAPTIIAVESSFRHVDSPDDEDWVSQTLHTDQGNRLFFGQAQPREPTARFAAHSIRSVTCIMGGAPTITFDMPAIEGRVGEEFTVMPHIAADDVLVESLGIYDIHWSSSDESVATVTKNSDGSITVRIVGEGSVSIDARFGESPYDEFVASAGIGVSGTGTGSGDGDGGDGGSGDGGDGGGGSGDSDGDNGGDDTGDDDTGGLDDGDGTGDGGGANGREDGAEDGEDESDDGEGEEVNRVGGTDGDEDGDESADEEQGLPQSGGATLIVTADDPTQAAEVPNEAQDGSSEDNAQEEERADVAVTSSLPPGSRASKFRLLSASEVPKSAGATAGGSGGATGGIVAGLAVTATDDGRTPLYLLTAAVCLVFGCVRRAGSYQFAKDHIQTKAARAARRGRGQATRDGNERQLLRQRRI